jgi:hypothetical protein
MYAFRTSITLTDDRVIVRNLGLTDWISLTDIMSVDTGYSGTVIVTHDGRSMRGLAVEKPNYARWLRLQTRADRVVNEIRCAAGLPAGPVGR